MAKEQKYDRLEIRGCNYYYLRLEFPSITYLHSSLTVKKEDDGYVILSGPEYRIPDTPEAIARANSEMVLTTRRRNWELLSGEKNYVLGLPQLRVLDENLSLILSDSTLLTVNREAGDALGFVVYFL